MWSWVKVVWTGIKGLFGKGGIQIGKTNEIVSGVTLGNDAQNVTIANQVSQVHIHRLQVPEIQFEPTPAEVEILLRLDSSNVGYLHVFRCNGGYSLMVEGQLLSEPLHQQMAVQVQEAFKRLFRYGLLSDIQKNGEIFHLSSKGRAVARDLRGQIDRMERPDYSELERMMLELLQEMREDITNNPLWREIVVLDTPTIKYRSATAHFVPPPLKLEESFARVSIT